MFPALPNVLGEELEEKVDARKTDKYFVPIKIFNY